MLPPDLLNRRQITRGTRPVLRPMDEGELDPWIGWVLGQAGLKSSAYRPAAMQRRIPACLRHLRVNSTASARELLERRPELIAPVLNTALIGVSGFFRDQPVFECVENVVVPRLAGLRRPVRVCSAGVSGGQEIYSVAMLLAEAGMLADAILGGVDCRPDAIRQARAGHYGADEMSGVTDARRSRFFRMSDDRWTVVPELQERIRWRVRDLLVFDPEETWDLILFRNVAIYLNEPHGFDMWSRLWNRLSPGGFIVTGKAERPPATLPLIRLGPSVYRKVPYDL
jgi:chemotaxis protein methyltransferase CheR